VNVAPAGLGAVAAAAAVDTEKSAGGVGCGGARSGGKCFSSFGRQDTFPHILGREVDRQLALLDVVAWMQGHTSTSYNAMLIA
jgi:hypothetical protein